MNRRVLPSPFLGVACAIAIALTSAACDDTFQPFAPGGRPFSIYGHLDAGADTQWVRVEMMRPIIATSSGPTGATVTLRNLATGQTLRLTESVGRLSAMSGASHYVHNFWTTERIEPGTAYRFLARQPSGDSATAVVKVPRSYAVEVWLGQPWASGDRVVFRGVRVIAFATQTVFFDDSCGSSSERRNLAVPASKADTISIVLGASPPVGRGSAGTGCHRPVLSRRELWVAASDTAWPSAVDYSVTRPGAAEEPSNISNGMGFLGAVLTKRIPYESCQYAYRATGVNQCVLRYDSLASTVKGVVFNRWCKDLSEGYLPTPDTFQLGGPYQRVARVAVTMKELTPKGGLPPRIRAAVTDRMGAFSIGALEPGLYELSYFRDEIPDPDVLEYEPVADTILVAQRQQVTVQRPMTAAPLCRIPDFLW